MVRDDLAGRYGLPTERFTVHFLSLSTRELGFYKEFLLQPSMIDEDGKVKLKMKTLYSIPIYKVVLTAAGIVVPMIVLSRRGGLSGLLKSLRSGFN